MKIIKAFLKLSFLLLPSTLSLAQTGLTQQILTTITAEEEAKKVEQKTEKPKKQVKSFKFIKKEFHKTIKK